MLLKSVEHIFWLGRYLERLDNTARLVNATSHLLIDSHKDTKFSWPVLLDVMGLNSAKALDSYQLPADAKPEQASIESAVMSHLISNKDSTVSIRYTCSQLKFNARTIRQLIPRDMWEELNKLDLFLKQHCQQLQGRQHRYNLMTEVSRRCQMVVGVLDGVMLRGDAFDLFNSGRLLERADMTTRIMDVLVLQQLQPTQIKRPKFRWTSILNALGGIESYHYYVAEQSGDVDAIDYLLTYADFPRSIAYCLNRVAASARTLPHSSSILQQVYALQDLLKEQPLTDLSTKQLHVLIDKIQTGIITLHQVIVEPTSSQQSQQLSA
ncbi:MULTISPECIES: alpha-E domain-containing protein [unclassified Arsukibacterium]|uniref:alpha-E domain-containing protein n=1 Tax=unclassified Arsukibacterium TaxID=2635278 RepID=UPI000C95FDF7|nr:MULTISPECIES: alpha-E domain-containing protein [unclassified Arsukibacterium]MAA95894.1 hypothetical protein [Rheinheimera sp.]|tara:strand:- start:125224 stop:126192 length:969 start_codon:yes stop_codon:yes gene_type:complete